MPNPNGRQAPLNALRAFEAAARHLSFKNAAQELPVVSADDGMFAIAALLDEIAMSLPDLRPLWATSPLQGTRWATNNAGV